ncbi:alpha/beta-hydrolase [Trichoderma citrinoviride]|uniref:Alpha/beta-hydrolase n=1 Tax=Trichoderma citrinoviride TaxID=58853 RepID=A0A2T4B8X9_9HYPO|nr:alpha/beta-hydrolase [Trichoderma citrinoviride]PTB65787.1 alpha/beta-hydrolase [Trichoderma citrinoviride]
MPFLKLQDRDRQLYYNFAAPQNAASDSTKITTLVLIHGLGSSSSFYAPVIPRLVEAGYSCLALDSHGSGLTKLTGEGGSIDTIIDDVGAAISALNIPPSRAVIVGHSMGGLVAPEATLRYHFAGTVLLGSIFPNEALTTNLKARIVKVQQDGMDALVDAIPKVGTAPTSTPLQRAFIRALLLAQTPEGYIANCKAACNASTPEYASIKTPLLFVVGAQDVVCPLTVSKKIYDDWGSADKHLKILDGTGHWYCIEAPEKVGDAIVEFTDGLKVE